MPIPPIKLIAINPTFEQQDGFYSVPIDGDVTQVIDVALAQQISSLNDCGAFSEEVEAQLSDDSYLSLLRPQLFRAFDFKTIDTVLEITNDCGNISRYLGENCTVVETIKLSQNAARATAYRCADMNNVGVFHSQIGAIELPQKYYDLVVLSDLELLAKDQHELSNILKKATAALSENGILVLSCENPKPLNRWFDTSQAIPYIDLYGENKPLLIQNDWLHALADLGLKTLNQHCVLPNTQNPQTILSKDYLDTEVSASNHFYGAGLVDDSNLNEYLLIKELKQKQTLFELASSYLIIAGRESADLPTFYHNDFTHFAGSARRRQWRTVTSKPIGQDAVTKQRLYDDFPKEITSSLVVQDISKQDFQRGKSLAAIWLECLTKSDAAAQFERHLIDYYAWLTANESEWGHALYDILPFNLIVDAQGEYHVIDPEWQVTDGINADFVFFRALFWFGFQNRQVLRYVGIEHGLYLLSDFVAYGLQLVGSKIDVAVCTELETKIQRAVAKQFHQSAIDDTLNLPIGYKTINEIRDLTPSSQVFFYHSDDLADYVHSATLSVEHSGTPETLVFPIGDIAHDFNTIRIDPIDRTVFFRATHIRLLNEHKQPIWSANTEQEIVELATLHNVSYSDSHMGNFFVADNNDPQFVIDVSDVTGLAAARYLSIELTYYPSVEYSMVMDKLDFDIKLQQQIINDLSSELSVSSSSNEKLEANFEFLKANSDKQHKLIENLTGQIKRMNNRRDIDQDQIDKQQDVIEQQQEMMQRTPITRAKLLAARLLGNEEEVVIEEAIEPVVERNSKAWLLGQNNEDYALWIEATTLNQFEKNKIKAEIAAFKHKPVFSIVVPVYNIDEEYLMMAVESVRNQLYPHWELCLVDDASPDYHIRPMLKRLMAMDERIVVKLNKQNQGIAGASNDAVSLTSGDYVALLDHDDEISIDALYENAKVINKTPNIGFIYSDEDKVTMEGRRVDPFFKPEYSPDLLDSQNYICHFSVISQTVIEKIGAFRLGYDGSQDHDLIIRAIEESETVAHIPKVLYHWRKVPGSTADVYDAKNYAWEAGRKAVESRLELSGDAGEVVLGPLQGTYQVKRDIIGNPKISIVIPFKDKPELLESCLNSILQNNLYANYEVIGVSNNSEEARTKEVMQAFQLQHENIRFVEKNVPFNFSLLCNCGVSESDGEYILLLNNDIEIRSPDWLERLLEHAQRDQIGAVGGKLFFPDGRIQHSGVVAGMHGAAGHSHLYFGGDNIGYYGSLMVTRNVSAVTGAMLLVSRAKYDQVGGLDEENLAVAYNDVDFCLKLLDQGYRNIITPFCHAVHHESASRGYEDNPEKVARLEKEKSHFVTKWQTFLEQGDPYFNPNFDLDHFDFKIKL